MTMAESRSSSASGASARATAPTSGTCSAGSPASRRWTPGRGPRGGPGGRAEQGPAEVTRTERRTGIEGWFEPPAATEVRTPAGAAAVEADDLEWWLHGPSPAAAARAGPVRTHGSTVRTPPLVTRYP